MRMGHMIRLLTAHICMICSVAFIMIRILDWYNPYMDFLGHAAVVQNMLCIGAFLLAVMQISASGKRRT